MAIDQSSNYSNPVTRLQVAYVQSYCSTQGSCPDEWQSKIAMNYPPDKPTASADTLAPSEKVQDMRQAPIPEAELKHKGQCAGVHGTAAVAAACDQAVDVLSKQMKEAQANLAPKVKAEVRKTRLEKLRKKHGHHYHHHAHHLADGSTRANGHHERDAKAVHRHKTAKATHHHAAPPVIVARSVVTPPARESKPNTFLDFLRRNANKVVARWDKDHNIYA